MLFIIMLFMTIEFVRTHVKFVLVENIESVVKNVDVSSVITYRMMSIMIRSTLKQLR